MITTLKVSEHKTLVGVYAVVTKGKSQNQRWRVEINGAHFGPFKTKNQALQEALHQLLILISLTSTESN